MRSMHCCPNPGSHHGRELRRCEVDDRHGRLVRGCLRREVPRQRSRLVNTMSTMRRSRSPDQCAAGTMAMKCVHGRRYYLRINLEIIAVNGATWRRRMGIAVE